MRGVLAQQPDLQNLGFGVIDRRRKTADQIRTEIDIGRVAMLRPEALAQFEAARVWLRQFPKIQQPNHKGTSYGLKHVAEQTIGYCTNGVFIAAAVAEGFEVRPSRPNSPNACLNIATKAWSWKSTPGRP